MTQANQKLLHLFAFLMAIGFIRNEVQGQTRMGTGPFHRAKVAHNKKSDLGQPFIFINASPMLPYPLWDGMIDHRYGVHRPQTVSKVPATFDKVLSPRYLKPVATNVTQLPYPNIPTKAAAFSAQQRAEAEFREGNYEEAKRLARQVVILDPENGMARLFSAQTLFAVNDYPAAVQEIKTAIDLLPPQDWDAVVRDFRLFYGKNDYVDQMDRLNQFLMDFPTHREGHLLRGYQFASLGYVDAAINDLQYAIAVRADERLASDLLRWVRGEKFSTDDSQINAPLPSLLFQEQSSTTKLPVLIVPQAIEVQAIEDQKIEDLPMIEELPMPHSTKPR